MEQVAALGGDSFDLIFIISEDSKVIAYSSYYDQIEEEAWTKGENGNSIIIGDLELFTEKDELVMNADAEKFYLAKISDRQDKGYLDELLEEENGKEDTLPAVEPENEPELAISTDNENWHVVAYYDLYSTADGDNTIYTGRIPVMINGKCANLITMIDDESAEIVGATFDYKEDADIVSKTLYELSEGDEIQPVCDYYDYDGNFIDAYTLEGVLTYKDGLYLGDVDISSYKTLISYEFRDMYGQNFYSTALK